MWKRLRAFIRSTYLAAALAAWICFMQVVVKDWPSPWRFIGYFVGVSVLAASSETIRIYFCGRYDKKPKNVLNNGSSLLSTITVHLIILSHWAICLLCWLPVLLAISMLLPAYWSEVFLLLVTVLALFYGDKTNIDSNRL